MHMKTSTEKRFGNQDVILHDSYGSGGWAWQERNSEPGEVVQCAPVAAIHEPRADMMLPPDNVLAGLGSSREDLQELGINEEGDGYEY